MSEKYIRVIVDSGADLALFNKYGVNRMPTLVFLGPDGKEVSRVTPRDDASLKKAIEEVAAKHARGPKWLEGAGAALEAGKNDGKPVVLVFADGKSKSERLRMTFGDPILKDLYEK